MSFAYTIAIRGLEQLITRVLPYGFQQAIACLMFRLAFRYDQGFVDQLAQKVENFKLFDAFARTNGFCCLQGATTGKYGEAPK